jgi:hypothetical protein
MSYPPKSGQFLSYLLEAPDNKNYTRIQKYLYPDINVTREGLLCDPKGGGPTRLMMRANLKGLLASLVIHYERVQQGN